jgi:AmpD protein
MKIAMLPSRTLSRKLRPRAWRSGAVLVALALSTLLARPLSADTGETPQPANAALAIDDGHPLPADLYSDRPDGTKIDTVVIHFISAIEVDAAKAYDIETIIQLFHPDAPTLRPATSAHYLIERSGRVCRLVPELKRAWHAGASKMPPPDNREKVNDFSIGIELVMTPTDTPTAEQYESLALLIRDLKTRYPDLKADNIVGHDTVRAGWNAAHPDAPAFVKPDPGPLFHWSRLMRRLNELKF